MMVIIDIFKTLMQFIALVIVFAGAALAVMAFGVILFLGFIQLILSVL
jgi:hypothetical protein